MRLTNRVCVPSLLPKRNSFEFGLAALDEPSSKIFIHCAAGVHRAPMMTLAVLGARVEF
jgi:protein-tyrosine phosphatase